VQVHASESCTSEVSPAPIQVGQRAPGGLPRPALVRVIGLGLIRVRVTVRVRVRVRVETVRVT
jgi:hypothetical protein